MPSGKHGLPENVTEYKDRHKRWRLRFRKKGLPTYHFKHPFGSPEFREELEAARAAKPARSTIGAERVKPGSLSALIVLYYQSVEFKDLAESSKRTYRNQLDRFRKAFGDLPVKSLDRAAIKKIIASMDETPAAANNLLDRLKVLMVVAIDNGWRIDDPTYKLKGFKNEGPGFHTWTDDEIDQFKARHPAGSKPRLALYMLLYLVQRRSDIVELGRQHRRGDRIEFRQIKTGRELSLRIHPDLQAEFDLAPKGELAYLVTEHGTPYSAAGFGNWFRRQCDMAGLPQCSAHGLRKAGARRMAEGARTNAQIKAVTGHVTDKEVARYTRAADQRRLSDQAIDALSGPPETDGERPLANLRKIVGEPPARR